MPQPLSQNPIGTPFIELQSVDSTNNYALNLVHEGLAQHGTAVFAHEQLRGKGQRAKLWASEKDANIALSIVVNPYPLQVFQQFQLIACAAVSVHEIFNKYAVNNAYIKWPNDLYWQDRKAGGILIENIIRSGQVLKGEWKMAVIGIGININQTSFPAELPNPVSLKQITGNVFDPVLLAKEFCEILDKYFHRLISEGFENIYHQYLNHLYKKDKKVKLKKGNKVFETTIKGVSVSGKLITQLAMEENPINTGFDFGEIEWIL